MANNLQVDALTTEGVSHETGDSISADQVILMIIYCIIGLLGIVGNTLVIYLVVRVPSLRSVTNVLICNQAMIDLASSVFFVCLYLVPLPPLPDSPLAASVLCKLWLSSWPLWGCSVSSTVNLVLLTLERHFAVMHPIKYRCKFSLRRAKFLAVIPWFVGPLHELTWALVQTVDSEEGCVPSWPSVTLQRVLGVVFFADHYMLPVTIMVYVYTKIILRLRHDWLPSSTSPSRNARARNNNASKDTSNPENRSSASGRDTLASHSPAPNPQGTRRQYRLSASKNVLKTLLIVSISYVICWGPNEIFYLLFNLGVEVQFKGFYHNLSVIFALCSMCLNPIIYAFHYEELKKALRKQFPCKMREEMKLTCCRNKSRAYEVDGIGNPLATVTSQATTTRPL